MSFTYCHDAGAPVLNNAAGSLITLLDYVLVTGTGWTKVFSGTNKAVYRAPLGRRLYLRVDDSFGAYARIVGYESMTDVDSGVNPFPTEVQFAGGLYVVKAASASGFPYAIAASSRGFVCWLQPISAMPDTQGNASSYGGLWGFGDLKPALTDDPYAVYLLGYTSSSYGSAPYQFNPTADQGQYVARAYHGLGSGALFGKYTLAKYTTYTYPNPADNGIYLDPMRVNEAGYSYRGTIPGLWQLVHLNGSIPHGTSFDGFGAMLGKTFLSVQGYSTFHACIETSTGGWDY